MNSLVNFMSSTTGRIARMVVGLVLIGLGVFGSAGIVVAVIGLVPLAAGLFNFCFLAPIAGRPLRGSK